jgi:hypothetical protein
VISVLYIFREYRRHRPGRLEELAQVEPFADYTVPGDYE